MREKINYLGNNAGGLEINHIRSNVLDLFIKKILEDMKTNIYIDAVVRKYCKDEDVYPSPVKPSYLDICLISKIKLVLGTSNAECSIFNETYLQYSDEG